MESDLENPFTSIKNPEKLPSICIIDAAAELGFYTKEEGRVVKETLIKENALSEEQRDALDGLRKKHINMKVFDEKGEQKEIFTNLILEGKFYSRSEIAEIKILSELMPQMIGLAKGYTKFLLNVAFNSSSPNVMKLYYLISHFRDKKIINIRINALRELLGIEGKYKEPNEIKRWILQPAMQELKAKADVWKELYQINLLPDKKLKNIGGYTVKVLGEKFKKF